MQTCVAKREGKLIDARFLRPLSEGERSKMEDHLAACGWCRERYRKLQLADRVAAFGAEAELDVPAPIEIDRIARDLGLLEATKPRRAWFDLRFVGAAVAAALALVIFLRPSDELVERGAGPSAISFSAYAKEGSGWRLLEQGARVDASEHLMLRLSWGASTTEIGGIDVLLVAADGAIEHEHLPAPPRKTASASVPGAIALSGISPGPLTAYLVAAKSFELAKVRELAARRASPEELARALDDASVERIDLEVVRR